MIFVIAESETMFSQRANKNPMTQHIKIEKPIKEILKEYLIPWFNPDKIKKVKVLGKGSFGKVYLAYNETVGFMAIKEIIERKGRFSDSAL